MMAIAVLLMLMTGILTFQGTLSTGDAKTIASLCFFLGFLPGFILHLIAMRQLSKRNIEK